MTAKINTKRFLGQQALFQLYVAPPKKLVHPEYQICIPNKLGMVDLMDMPQDKVTSSKILFYEDVASRLIQLQSLKDKKANSTSFTMRDILKFANPEKICADEGKEC